ncbi:IS701 family transposase [Kitasatospora sp. NPDC056446]|uniref:IS701 family transposase n=1 Tax=Kitasatospora sp. NPDC056446 TaxID=3345819 RepID=UPI003688377C
MTPDELAVLRDELEAFAAEVFAPLRRSDQRDKGLSYLRGLLLDGRRKSMQPMAERLGVDHQRLQQFISASTWPVEAVRARIARRAVETLAPAAWVIDDTGFPKDGTASPGVARQYSGTLGKVGSCQVGVSVHAVTDRASCPLDWRLFLPAAWDPEHAADEAAAARAGRRRARCRIPDSEVHRPKWRLAVETLDELSAWHLTAPVVVADAGYGDNAHFRNALDERGLRWIVQVKGLATAHPLDVTPHQAPYGGLGPRPKPRYRTRPIPLAEHVRAAGRPAARTVTWRHGSRDRLTGDFVVLRVRLAGRRPRIEEDGTLPVCWLLAQWPAHLAEPSHYWVSNLPADTPVEDLVRLAKIRWRIEHDYRELKTVLGLDHFEGRSWTGWHRHVTLVTAAHLFVTLARSRPKVPARA